MARRVADEDDWDDEDGDEPTVPCPHCGRPILEDLARCPYCENYLSEEDRPAARKPWWIILGALLVLYVVYRWIVSGCGFCGP